MQVRHALRVIVQLQVTALLLALVGVAWAPALDRVHAGDRIIWICTPPGLYPYICSRPNELGIEGTVIV